MLKFRRILSAYDRAVQQVEQEKKESDRRARLIVAFGPGPCRNKKKSRIESSRAKKPRDGRIDERGKKEREERGGGEGISGDKKKRGNERLRGRSRRGERCRWILTASATVSLEFSLLFSSASGAAGGADFELRLLHGPTKHEMRPAEHRVPVESGRGTALGAGVFQPNLQPNLFFFRGHGDWFQPELAVIATQHARLKHETNYLVLHGLFVPILSRDNYRDCVIARPSTRDFLSVKRVRAIVSVYRIRRFCFANVHFLGPMPSAVFSSSRSVLAVRNVALFQACNI